MVRLVILTIFLALAGCSLQPSLTEPASLVSTLPSINNGRLSALDEGEQQEVLVALYQKAEQARQQGRLAITNTYLDQARQIQPRNPSVLYRQAWCYYQLGKINQAEQLIQRALVFAQKDQAMTERLNQLRSASNLPKYEF